jgi:ATP-dependent Clp protease ATP-binding subunit ClpA
VHQPFFAPDLASDVLKEIEELLPHSQPLPTEANMPMSTDLKHTLGAASDIFEALQNKQIEPLHLLAAAVAEELSIGARTLRQAGITQERVLKAIRGEEQS